MDGAEEDSVGADEWGRAVKLEDGDALHVVLAGLAQADVVVERQHPLRGDRGQQRPIEVDLLLQVLGGEELVANATREQSWEGHIQDIGADICVVLDVENEDAVLGGGEHCRHPLDKQGEERRKEPLLGHVLQPHRDAVGQHVICDDGDTQGANSRNAVDAVWREKRNITDIRDQVSVHGQRRSRSPQEIEQACEAVGAPGCEREMHPHSAVNANAFTEENKMKLLKDGNSEISKSSAHTEKVPSKKQQEPASKQTARQPWDGREGSLSSHLQDLTHRSQLVYKAVHGTCWFSQHNTKIIVSKSCLGHN